MKQQWISLRLLLVASSLLFIFSAPVRSEPSNFTLLKKELVDYHDSGLYEQELTQKIEEARHYIIQQALSHQQEKTHQKLAVILDIDETSLSNYEKMLRGDFSVSSAEFHKEVQAANAPAIAPMLDLYQEIVKHGISVFFITGRYESEREVTQLNLTKAGYKNWAGLYLRPNEYSAPSIIPFKSGARAMISKQGYTIIAAIGDQYSDIRGGYTKKGFKLPNPYYYLP